MDGDNVLGDTQPDSWAKFLKGLECSVLLQTRYFFKPPQTDNKAVFQIIDTRWVKNKGGIIMQLERDVPKEGLLQFSINPNGISNKTDRVKIPKIVINAGEAVTPLVRIIFRAIEVTAIVSDNFRLWSAYQKDRRRIEDNFPEYDGPSEFTTTAAAIAGEWVVGIATGKALSLIYGKIGSTVGTPLGPASSCVFEFFGACLGAYHGGNWGTKRGSKLGQVVAQKLYEYFGFYNGEV